MRLVIGCDQVGKVMIEALIWLVEVLHHYLRSSWGKMIWCGVMVGLSTAKTKYYVLHSEKVQYGFDFVNGSRGSK